MLYTYKDMTGENIIKKFEVFLKKNLESAPKSNFVIAKERSG